MAWKAQQLVSVRYLMTQMKISPGFSDRIPLNADIALKDAELIRQAGLFD